MSGAPLTPGPNAQILEEASAWFVEFNEGEVEPAAREAFSQWLRSSPEHVRAYLAVSATFQEVGKLAGSRVADAETLIEQARHGGNVVPIQGGTSAAARAWEATHPLADASPKDRVTVRAVRPHRRAVFAVAAVLVIAVAALGWFMLFAGLYSTGTGEQRLVNLADGSTIELNAQSEIRVRLDREERVVELLAGQALFHVAKDARRPFIVRSGESRVRAVGTQFDVNRQGADTVVTVLEGRVAIAPAADRAPLYASAGEQVILTAQAASKPAHPNLSAATAWRERKLIFASSPLTEVAGEYNRYHERRLVIADAALSEFQISGVFSAADAESLIAFLRAQPNISIEEKETEIVLRGR